MVAHRRSLLLIWGLLAAGCLAVASSDPSPPDSPTVVASAAIPVATVQELASVAALRGTLVFSDPGLSAAILEIGRGESRIFRVGAEIPGMGVLTEVERSGIYFERGGVLIFLSFNDSAMGSSGYAVNRADNAGSAAGVIGAASIDSAAPGAGSGPAASEYVVPDFGQGSGMHDADDPSFDATPKPGQTIDTTDWDHVQR